jgi:2,5-diamino-6-(ribosylamino)-4(3H)-pyrimidinone 5'-phosphate reductase
VTLRQLLPEPGELTVEEAAAGLGLAEQAPPDRPYVVLNMISTADGKVTIEGRAGPIGNPTDQALLYALRARADAVMVGAGTARVERYGNLLPGREPPLTVIVSDRLDIPPDLPLLQEEDARVVYVTRAGHDLPPAPARAEYLRGEDAAGEVALTPAMTALREDFGVRVLVCEGGPTLNSALLRQGLADEFWLVIAPKLAGGADALTAVAGVPLAEPLPLELLRVLEEDSYLYVRYKVRRAAAVE